MHGATPGMTDQQAPKRPQTIRGADSVVQVTQQSVIHPSSGNWFVALAAHGMALASLGLNLFSPTGGDGQDAAKQMATKAGGSYTGCTSVAPQIDV